MKKNNLLSEFSSQSAHNELVGLLSNSEIKRIQIKGLYGSSKSFAFAAATGNGISFAIMDSKEEAQFFTNDLYNLLDEENVFFFPSSSNYVSNKINTIKDSSQKVQRSATISALNAFLNDKNKGKQLIIVSYPASIYEKIPNNKVLKKNILNIRKGEMVSHEFIKETLVEYKFEKVGEYVIRYVAYDADFNCTIVEFKVLCD